MSDLTQTRMTAEEFFQLPETNTPTELIDREIIICPAPLPLHQDTVLDIGAFLRKLSKEIGGKAYIAPIDVYLDDHNIVQPDILWIGADSQCVVTERRLVGAPDLVVEVLSPGTERRDRREKYRLYEKYGVREYWMVDPAAQYVEVIRLNEDGTFVQQGIYAPDENFESAVLGGRTVSLNTIFAG